MRALQQLPADSRRINVVLGAHKGGTAAMKKYIGCDAHARYTPLLARRDYLPLPPTGEAACLEMPAASNPGFTYHVTQRGTDRKTVFFTSADRRTYLRLAHQNLANAGVTALGFCLMTNHVHWLVRPQRDDSIAIFFQRLHGRYAQYLNARRQRSGHLWQNRFYSCPVSDR